MAVTGATFNFNKTVTDEEKPSTAAAPSDGAKIDTKMAGEKKGSLNTKDVINLSMVQQSLKTALSSTIQNIEGSHLAEQASALQSIANTAISSVFMAATNPYALLTSMASMAISLNFRADKYRREKKWEEYDLQEYNSRRGCAANRTRSG